MKISTVPFFLLSALLLPVATQAFFFFREFRITLDYVNVPFFQRWLGFHLSAIKWARVFPQDIVNVNDNRLPGVGETDCGPYPSEIDDVYMCVSYRQVDGPGGVLGAGFSAILRTSYLAAVTAIEFDEEDISLMFQRGIFRSKILTEMGSVLGINNFVLTSTNLTTPNTANPPCVYTSDSNANREWQEISGCTDTTLPTECGRWAEDCLQNELMTSTISSDRIISRISIAALEDIGYPVDYSQADGYGRDNLNATCRCDGQQQQRQLRPRSADDSTSSDLTLTNNPHNRRLSEQGKASAEAYGRAFIARNSPQATSEAGRGDGIDQDYVFGRSALVMVYEDGEVFAIEVEV